MRDRRKHDRDDRSCLARLARGETAALETIYDRHAGRLFAHAAWLLGNRDDAEDVVQSVFVKLAGRGAELLGVRRPGAYLQRMVHTEAIDLGRRRRARHEDPQEGALLDRGSGPAAERSSEAAWLERRIARLTAEQREVLYLHLWAGYGFREIGAITRVSTFTAASRYRLALARLRREIRT